MNGFREILLNSINHKQYEENNPVQISIYNDKIYVWNDGKFPEELASQNLFEKHYSKPYNPLIAQTFFKAGFIESWGRGFEKIKNECQKYNTPIPEIDIKTSGVMIKCNPSKNYMELLNRIKVQNGQKNVGLDVGLDVGLNEIQIKILKMIKENKNITQKEIALRLKTTSRTIERNISILKEMNKIERVGAKRFGYWKIL